MLVQFGNNSIKKILLTAKLDCGLVQFWLSAEFFSSSYFQIGQHVVLVRILIYVFPSYCVPRSQRLKWLSISAYRKCTQTLLKTIGADNDCSLGGGI